MNQGKNKGRTLKIALSRFSAMLIEEARDLTGMGYKELDEALDLEHGQCERYARYPGMKKDRAPQAAGIQQLENRVAKLLKRPAHRVVIIDNNKILSACDEIMDIDDVIGTPEAGINLREYDGAFLQLGYENDWPTYRRLKCSGRNLQLYSWQWGILWDRMTPCPYRTKFGFHQDEPIENCIMELMRTAQHERSRMHKPERPVVGREVLDQ